jgi:hypothetical protein
MYFLCFTVPVIAQAYEAWRDGFLTPSQMQAAGVARGLPFVAHGAMWWDATFFAAIMATILTRYARGWRRWQWAAALVAGLAVSAAMHWAVYVKGPLPGLHAHDGSVTMAGMIHVFYMALAIAVLLLFYVGTERPNPTFVKWVSALLIAHIIIGTHVLLNIWTKFAHPSWYPEGPIVDLPGFWTIAGGAMLVWAGSAWALRSQ